MELPIIKIGNSKGLRLSKTILKQYNIQERVELILEKGHIVIKPLNLPREGWEKQFREMAKDEEDDLLINDVFEEENFEEWK